jgi:predicted nuclease of predicted toxin-antitoxin system
LNLLADEGVDRQIVVRLREEGHNVSYVAEMEPGIPDETVLEFANSEARALLTADNDFGELAFRQRLIAASGIILVRLAGLSQEEKAKTVVSAISEHGRELVAGTFAVITPGTVRVRRGR